MRKKIILSVVTIGILIGLTTFFVIQKKKAQNKNGQPQQSVEEILKERARQAETHTQTPLGKSFTARNWVEFDKLYHPESDFHELGEIIRACFISNCFKEYKKSEIDQVFGYVVKTFEKMKSQDFSLAGLLITQFERLPSPPHGSANYKALESWYTDSNSSPAMKRMAVLKLGVQDSDPESKWVSAITHGVVGNTFGVTHSSWIQMVSDMRNLNARKVVLAAILKEFNKIEDDAQPDALIVLAQNSTVSPKQVKSIFFKFLSSTDQKEFEASLKSVIPQLDEHAFSPDEITKIKDRLNSIPEKLNTPYVDLKSKELLSVLK